MKDKVRNLRNFHGHSTYHQLRRIEIGVQPTEFYLLKVSSALIVLLNNFCNNDCFLFVSFLCWMGPLTSDFFSVGRNIVHGRSSVGYSARYTLLCCGFDSCRHTQILYEEKQKNALQSTKKQREKNNIIDGPSFRSCSARQYQ